MLKIIITEAVVSKGYEGAPGIRFFDSEGGGQIANFRIGKRVYDSKAADNHRWLNFSVKAFGDVCERIKRMKIKEGSYINIIARYDEGTWEDKNTHETRTGVVLYLDEIEYANSGNGQKNGQGSAGGSAPQNAGGAPAPQGQQGYPPQRQQGYPPQEQQGYPPQGQQGYPPQGQQGYPPQGQAPQPTDPMPSGFTGFENFGGQENPFF